MLRKTSYYGLQCLLLYHLLDVGLALFMLFFFNHFCRLQIFFKLTFSKNSFKNTIRVSNGSDPDQARCFVGPDRLHWLSADVLSRY